MMILSPTRHANVWSFIGIVVAPGAGFALLGILLYGIYLELGTAPWPFLPCMAILGLASIYCTVGGIIKYALVHFRRGPGNAPRWAAIIPLSWVALTLVTIIGAIPFRNWDYPLALLVLLAVCYGINAALERWIYPEIKSSNLDRQVSL